MPRDSRLFDRIGADALRAVLVDFYDRVFADVMIGFLFDGKDKARLVQREYELTARFLGADIPYTGRPMRQAHAQSPILGGHFDRRLEILRQTIAAHGVDAEVAAAWIDHTLALRSQITPDGSAECDDAAALLRVEAAAAAAPGPDPDRPIGLGRRRV
jgi:hemoglobin